MHPNINCGAKIEKCTQIKRIKRLKLSIFAIENIFVIKFYAWLYWKNNKDVMLYSTIFT